MHVNMMDKIVLTLKTFTINVIKLHKFQRKHVHKLVIN